jgi:TonB family protein
MRRAKAAEGAAGGGRRRAVLERSARATMCWLVVALAACGGAAPARPGPAPATTAGAPGPRLGAEPLAPEDQLGHDWLEAVHQKLHERWADGFLEQARAYLPPGHPLNDPALAVSIAFAVARDGQVRDADVARTSGDGDFDRAALELVAEASPLPPPPVDLGSDDGLTYVSWQFARDARQESTAGAAVERRLWEPARAVPALLAAGRVDEAAARVASGLRAGGDSGRLSGLARDVAGAALVQVLGATRDPEARVAAARGLGHSGWSGGDAALRRLAVEANDIVLQAAALRALGDLGDAEALPLLVEALRGDPERAAAAGYALVRTGHAAVAWRELGPRLAQPEDRLRALTALAEVGAPESAAPLVAILGAKERPRPERAAAAAALGPLAATPGGPPALALIAALGDGDAAVRAAAAAALARAPARGRVVAAAVEPLTRDRDPRVQAAAADALAHAEARDALPALLAAAHARDPAVVEAAVRAVGAAPGAEALTALRRFSGSSNPDVRAAALRALAARPEPEGRELAARHLGDEDPRTRAVAAGASADPAALEKALAADPEPEVRAAATRSLVRVGGAAATPQVLAALAAAPAPRARAAIAAAYLAATR